MRASRLVIPALAATVLAVTTSCSSGSSRGGTATAPSFPSFSAAAVPAGDTSASSSSSVPPAPPAKIAGWKPIPTKRGVAYDVPPDWEVKSAGTLVGWEDKKGPFFIMSGAAVLDNGYCPAVSGSDRGVTGVRAGGDASFTDATELARVIAADATRIYTDTDSGDKPTVSISVRPTTLLGNKAAIATATVTNIHTTASCASSRAVFTVVSLFPPGKPSLAFVIALDQGLPGAGDATQIPKIISSLRILN